MLLVPPIEPESTVGHPELAQGASALDKELGILRRAVGAPNLGGESCSEVGVAAKLDKVSVTDPISRPGIDIGQHLRAERCAIASPGFAAERLRTSLEDGVAVDQNGASDKIVLDEVTLFRARRQVDD